MNDREFENKVNRDIDRAKKDLLALGGDGITGVSRMFEHLGGDAMVSINGAVRTFNKGFGRKLSLYNEKIRDVAERVPGGFSKQAVKYPWLTISVSLFVGLLLGALLKPGRQQIVG